MSNSAVNLPRSLSYETLKNETRQRAQDTYHDHVGPLLWRSVDQEKSKIALIRFRTSKVWNEERKCSVDFPSQWWILFCQLSTIVCSGRRGRNYFPQLVSFTLLQTRLWSYIKNRDVLELGAPTSLGACVFGASHILTRTLISFSCFFLCLL